MGVEIRGTHDPLIDKLGHLLELYHDERPKARIALYRQNPGSIRLRIIDPAFDGLSKVQRSTEVWDWLEHHWTGPDEDLSYVSMLILLTPSEVRKSIANLEFEDPVPSGF